MPRGFDEPYTSMAVLDGDRLIAGIVYNNWYPEAGVIEFHGASTTPRWLTRPVLRAMFSYPFDQIGCQLVLTRSSERNDRLHRQLHSLGFESTLIPRLRGRDEGERVCWLTDDAWRSNGF